jgi:RNA polymerase sigma-70 factor (ECF subfamily)
MQTSVMLTDRDLLCQYVAIKDVGALEIIVNRYKKRLFTTILLMVKDRAAAEDIFQDTFIKIIDVLNSGNYSEEGKFLPWASRIAHNLCIDYFRKAKKMPTISIVYGDEGGEESNIFDFLDTGELNIEQKIIAHQTNTQLQQLVHLLPVEQREVLVMRLYADLSFKEIAQQTNVSINTALGRMRYALSNLRKIIEENKIEL